MKKFLFMISLLLVSFLTFAQDGLENYKIEGKIIVWQKVYEFPLEDSSKVSNFFYNNTNFHYEDNIGICYYRLGYESSLKPIQMPLVLKEYARVKFIVQIKKGRYRVTVQSFEPADTFAQSNMGKEVREKTYLSNFFIDTYFKKDGTLRQTFYSVAPYLNEALENVFYYNRNTNVLDDDF